MRNRFQRLYKNQFSNTVPTFLKWYVPCWLIFSYSNKIVLPNNDSFLFDEALDAVPPLLNSLHINPPP